MFNKTKEYKEIKEELNRENLLNRVANFESFTDGFFMFYLKDNNSITHEFLIKCDDTVLRDMTTYDLINLKRIEYFNHTVYLDKDNSYTKIWSIISESGLN